MLQIGVVLQYVAVSCVAVCGSELVVLQGSVTGAWRVGQRVTVNHKGRPTHGTVCAASAAGLVSDGALPDPILGQDRRSRLVWH